MVVSVRLMHLDGLKGQMVSLTQCRILRIHASVLITDEGKFYFPPSRQQVRRFQQQPIIRHGGHSTFLIRFLVDFVKTLLCVLISSTDRPAAFSPSSLSKFRLAGGKIAAELAIYMPIARE